MILVDLSPSLQCKYCREILKAGFFQHRTRPSGKIYRSRECKACVSARTCKYVKDNPGKCAEYAKRWRELHPDGKREDTRRWRKKNRASYRTSMLKKYGVTHADYERMFVQQGKRCAICGSETVRRTREVNFHVDHCHVTGKVRGLLCNHCNTGLGLFGDNEERLASAVIYLKRSRA